MTLDEQMEDKFSGQLWAKGLNVWQQQDYMNAVISRYYRCFGLGVRIGHTFRLVSRPIKMEYYRKRIREYRPPPTVGSSAR